MAGFGDLVQQAQPAIVGGGVSAAATEGRDWEWEFDGVVDIAGTNIDLTTATGVCKVWDDLGGTEIVTLTFTGSVGGFTISKGDADTVGLASGANDQGRQCRWGLIVTLAGVSVQFWGPSNSRFTIKQEA